MIPGLPIDWSYVVPRFVGIVEVHRLARPGGRGGASSTFTPGCSLLLASVAEEAVELTLLREVGVE